MYGTLGWQLAAELAYSSNVTSLPHAAKIRKVESFVRENKVGKMVNFELKGPLKKDGIYFFTVSSIPHSIWKKKEKKKKKET